MSDRDDDVAVAEKPAKVNKQEKNKDHAHDKEETPADDVDVEDTCSIEFIDDCDDEDQQIVAENVEPQAKAAAPAGQQAAIGTSTQVQPIKYAPKIQPVVATLNLYCIAIDWKDSPSPDYSSSEVSGAGKIVADNYKKVSRGNIKFNVIPKVVKVNQNKDRKNLADAEAEAKNKAVVGQKNENPNLFAVFTKGVSKVNHASGNTAHMIQRTGSVTTHEISHLKPMSLQHSNMRLANGKVESSTDGSCWMSIKSSSQLTAAQTYARGWFPENKVAQYALTDFAPVEFDVETLDSDDSSAFVKAVRIPRQSADGKAIDPLFLSMPKIPTGSKNSEYKLALHTLYSNSGTVREAVFVDKAQFEDLSFKTVAKTNKSWKVQVSRAKLAP